LSGEQRHELHRLREERDSRRGVAAVDTNPPVAPATATEGQLTPVNAGTTNQRGARSQT
jgi:hypothetical protein